MPRHPSLPDRPLRTPEDRVEDLCAIARRLYQRDGALLPVGFVLTALLPDGRPRMATLSAAGLPGPVDALGVVLSLLAIAAQTTPPPPPPLAVCVLFPSKSGRLVCAARSARATWMATAATSGKRCAPFGDKVVHGVDGAELSGDVFDALRGVRLVGAN